MYVVIQMTNRSTWEQAPSHFNLLIGYAPLLSPLGLMARPDVLALKPSVLMYSLVKYMEKSDTHLYFYPHLLLTFETQNMLEGRVVERQTGVRVFHPPSVCATFENLYMWTTVIRCRKMRSYIPPLTEDSTKANVCSNKQEIKLQKIYYLTLLTSYWIFFVHYSQFFP